MKFEEVVPALREGKKIRRKEWEKEMSVSLSYFRAEPSYGFYVLSILDDDWEIVDEK